MVVGVAALCVVLCQVRLLLLAAMCREHILLIGPPGELDYRGRGGH